MIANFRDLGGIKCENGRTVKNGFFYRSAMIDRATDEEFLELKKLGIKVAYDFRDANETRGDRPYAMIGAEHRNVPATYKNDKLFKMSKGGGVLLLFRKVTWHDVAETYEHLPVGNNAYKELIKSVVAGETPLLMHCSAGKDRAGIAATIILLLLGVGYEEILEEYLKSTKVQHFIESVIGERIPKIFHKFAFRHFHAYFTVYKELLDTSLNRIKEVYGDYETYFLKEFGITPEMREELIARYTE